MDIRDFRNIMDRQRGVDRKEIYGSNRAHFPYPHKILANQHSKISKFGTPGALIRNTPVSNKTTNYEHLQNLKGMAELFSK